MRFSSPILLACASIVAAPPVVARTASGGDGDGRRRMRRAQSSVGTATTCVCSPRSFAITLDLSSDCSVDTLGDNAGITDAGCAVASGDDVGGMTAEEDGESVGGGGRRRRRRRRRRRGRRGLQRAGGDGGEKRPVRVTSATLVEIGPTGTIINVDDRYADADFADGDSFDLASASSRLDPNAPIEDQLDLVPTTQVLFVIGENARGEEVRGRFTFVHSNSCGGDAIGIVAGDAFGWISFGDGTTGPIGEFCPAAARQGGGGDPSSPPPRPTRLPTTKRKPTVSVGHVGRRNERMNE
jgi:hypothetical protein